MSEDRAGRGAAPGLGNSWGQAMTSLVWGWRREDTSQIWAWVPVAEGGRGAAMLRRTPGELSAKALGGRPEPSGHLDEGRQEGREGALGPGKMQGLALGQVWGPRLGRTHS